MAVVFVVVLCTEKIERKHPKGRIVEKEDGKNN